MKTGEGFRDIKKARLHSAWHAACVALVVLQVLDLHSSLRAREASEINHLVVRVAEIWGLPSALIAAKVVAIAGIACLTLIRHRFPRLEREVTVAATVAALFYTAVVFNNYGVAA